MKKLIPYIVCTLIFLSCEDPHKPDYSKKQLGETGVHVNGTISIEGCEYLVVGTYYNYSTLVHKGNCKNPIHYLWKDSDSTGKRE